MGPADRSRLHGELPSTSRLEGFLSRDARFISRTISTNVELDQSWRTDHPSRASLVRKVIGHVAGIPPSGSGVAQQVEEIGIEARDGYDVKYLEFEIVSGLRVRAELYIPDGVDHGPAVLHPQGHWPAGRGEISDTSALTTACINLALRGYVVLAYDMVGYGHALDVGHGFASDDYYARQLGISLFGLQHHMGRVCLEFLIAQPMVDSSRIACVGASGGGSQVLALAASDERISVAVPVNILSGHNQGWCLCENPPALRTKFSNLDFAAAIAPRPLLIVSATGDWTVNTPTVEWPQIQDVYRSLDAADRTEQVQIDAGHNYNRESREAIYKWLDRWFMLEGTEDDYLEVPIPRGTEQYDLPKKLPPGREALVLQNWGDTIVEGAERLLTGDSRILLSHLRRRLDLDVQDPQPRVLGSTRLVGYGFDVKEGICAYGGNSFLYRAYGTERARHGVLVVLNQLSEDTEWLRFAEKVVSDGGRLFAVFPFLTGPWHTGLGQLGRVHKGPFPLTYNRHDSVERVHDIVAAVNWIGGSLSISRLSVFGLGNVGPATLLSVAVTGLYDVVAVDLPEMLSVFGVPYSSKVDCMGLAGVGGLGAATRLIKSRTTVLGSVPDDTRDQFPVLSTGGTVVSSEALTPTGLSRLLYGSAMET